MVVSLSYWWIWAALLSVLHAQQGSQLTDGQTDDFRGCLRPVIPNGVARLQARRMVAKFKCNNSFRLIGPRYANCVKGAWDTEFPKCVRPGCEPPPPLLNGRKASLHGGAMVFFICKDDFSLQGSATLLCDGRRWNATFPICYPNEPQAPATVCDFDNYDLCGWSYGLPGLGTDWITWNVNDVEKRGLYVRLFSWNQVTAYESTPWKNSGPGYDHTFGEGIKGRYIMADSIQAASKSNETAYFVSPVYPSSTSGACFIFYYSMRGPKIGMLRVYQKTLNQSLYSIPSSWEISGHHDDVWNKAVVMLRPVLEPFQIVFEAKRDVDQSGGIAIDDVLLDSGDACASLVDSTDDGDNCADGKCSVTTEMSATPAEESFSSVDNDIVPRTVAKSTAPVPTSTVPVPKSTTRVPTSTTRVPTSTTRVPTSTTPVPTSTSVRTTRSVATTAKLRSTAAATTARPRATTTTTRLIPGTPKTTSKPRTTALSSTGGTPPARATKPPIVWTTANKPLKPAATTERTRSTRRATMITSSELHNQESDASLALVLAITGLVGTLLLVGGATFALIRRRRLKMLAREMEPKDSDVRYLVSSDGEIQLDFTLATPLL